MTLKGHAPLDDLAKLQAARLMQLHEQTHPIRIGAKLGVSAGYIRQIWERTRPEELGDLTQALSLLER